MRERLFSLATFVVIITEDERVRQLNIKGIILMKDDNSRSKRSNQVFWLIMGFVWIAFALFGLIFDPEKRVIIISQIVAGGLCLAIFIVSKLRKTKD
jgi:hypothetical protein